MAFSWEAVVDEIVKVLKTVTGVDRVYPYLRDVHDEYAFFAALGAVDEESRLHGWFVTRTRIDEERQPGLTPIQQAALRHNVMIEGYYSKNDERGTELEFQQLVDDIVSTLIPHLSYNDTVEDTEPLNVSIGYELLGPYLLHTCTIFFTVKERRIAVGFR